MVLGTRGRKFGRISMYWSKSVTSAPPDPPPRPPRALSGRRGPLWTPVSAPYRVFSTPPAAIILVRPIRAQGRVNITQLPAQRSLRTLHFTLKSRVGPSGGTIPPSRRAAALYVSQSTGPTASTLARARLAKPRPPEAGPGADRHADGPLTGRHARPLARPERRSEASRWHEAHAALRSFWSRLSRPSPPPRRRGGPPAAPDLS